MNIVNAWGGTKKKRELAEDVVNFCIEALMPRMRTLDVTIELSRDMDNADGFCLAETKRQFIIEIDSRLNYEDFVSCICHEMVHVKQHARNELQDLNLLTKRWKDQEYFGIYSTIEEYMALPWEAEAYELQEVLLERYNELRK
jgi:hypothetical protein